MEATTTEPSLFLYSGDYIPKIKGKGGVMYNKRQGLALETAAYAHSINIEENDQDYMLKPGFNHDLEEYAKGRMHILRPGGPSYLHETTYSFGWNE